MSIFGNLFRTPGAGDGPPLDLDGAPIDRQIAARMAYEINNEPQFAGVTAEQIANPKRRLKDMVEGDVLVDCLGVGVRSEVWNRRNYRREYLTHAALRSKLTDGQVTPDILDTLGIMSQAVQTFFESVKRIDLDDGASATLIKAEPFVHVARGQLFGEGLFLSPIQFAWLYHPG